ncbi:MAG: oligopeptide transporter, OPT family, partial [Ruminococcaceae bacterium]|nr:oligopeptide transporter, OPT family [Oscillospiraceae bacterium]
MDNQNNFKPYIPAEKITPELTVTSIIVGMLLAVIFGAANAYLGLKVGMTVSASIPSAVIAMGIIKMILRRNSVLEVNMVQTIGSSGESLAAGAIFTLPALFIWASEGVIAETPSIVEITLIAVIGGLLGIFFMVPLRNALIVKEHGILPYPEGTACSEVILAGEKGGASAKTVFAGMGFAALFKFIIDGLKVVAGEVAVTFKGFAGTIGTQIYPAVMSVGYICGPRISSFMFSGGILAWLVLIPLIVFFGGDAVQTTFAAGGAYGIWSNYIKYIGAGALVAGGFISLIKSMPLIVKTFADAIKGLSFKANGTAKRTEKDMNFLFVILGVLILTLVIWIVDIIPVPFVGALIIVIFGFFFATVSSRMVGLVG